MSFFLECFQSHFHITIKTAELFASLRWATKPFHPSSTHHWKGLPIPGSEPFLFFCHSVLVSSYYILAITRYLHRDSLLWNFMLHMIRLLKVSNMISNLNSLQMSRSYLYIQEKYNILVKLYKVKTNSTRVLLYLSMSNSVYLFFFCFVLLNRYVSKCNSKTAKTVLNIYTFISTQAILELVHTLKPAWVGDHMHGMEN